MGNKDKDKEHSNAGAMGTDADAACNVCQASQDLSHERATAPDRMVVEAITRETSQITATFTASLNERTAVNCQRPLKSSLEQQVSRQWSPLSGPGTRLSATDGNSGQRRLDMPLRLWKETQKRQRFHISTTG